MRQISRPLSDTMVFPWTNLSYSQGRAEKQYKSTTILQSRKHVKALFKFLLVVLFDGLSWGFSETAFCTMVISRCAFCVSSALMTIENKSVVTFIFLESLAMRIRENIEILQKTCIFKKRSRNSTWIVHPVS